MKKALINLLIVSAAAALAFNVGLRAGGPLRVECSGPKPTAEKPDSGAIGGEGSCELPWIICWKSA